MMNLHRAGAAFVIGNCYLTRRDRGKERTPGPVNRELQDEQRRGYEPLSPESREG